MIVVVVYLDSPPKDDLLANREVYYETKEDDCLKKSWRNFSQSFFKFKNQNASWCQFYQHFKSTLCVDILAPKSTNLKCKKKKLGANFEYKKASIKCWCNWAMNLYYCNLPTMFKMALC